MYYVPIGRVLEDYVAHMRLHNRETQGAHIQSVIGLSQIIGYLIVVYPLPRCRCIIPERSDFPAEPL